MRVSKTSMSLLFLIFLSGCLLFSSHRSETELSGGCKMKTDYRNCMGFESYKDRIKFNFPILNEHIRFYVNRSGVYCPILSELGYSRGFSDWSKSFLECEGKSYEIGSGTLKKALAPITDEEDAFVAIKVMYGLGGRQQPDYIFESNLFDNVCISECNLTGVNLTNYTRVEKLGDSYLVNVVACGLRTGTGSTPFLGLREIKYNVTIKGDIIELSNNKLAYCRIMFAD